MTHEEIPRGKEAALLTKLKEELREKIARENQKKNERGTGYNIDLADTNLDHLTDLDLRAYHAVKSRDPERMAILKEVEQDYLLHAQGDAWLSRRHFYGWLNNIESILRYRPNYEP